MKNINTYIKESGSKKFTKEELYKDYESASYVTGQEKKDLIAKYSIQSKKAKDIQNKILLLLRDLRKNQKTFDKEDISDFLKLHDYVTKRMIDGLLDEPKEFGNFLKDYYLDRVKTRKLENYINVKSFTYYRISNADKDLIKTYQKIAEAVAKINPTEEQKKTQADTNTIYNKLYELMSDFHDVYIKQIENYAKKVWAYHQDKDNLKKLELDVKATEKAIEKYKEEKGIRWISYNDYLGNQYEKANEKARNKVSQFKAFNKMYKSEAEYLDRCIKDGESQYKMNVMAITERIMKENLNISEMEISDVKNDPKFFEMFIKDSKKKIYCRSVLAAQFSVKMIPHFRFIITERK